MEFSTKAETLLRLNGKIKAASILEVAFFTVAEWKENKEACLEKVGPLWDHGQKLIVRSSALSEDTSTQSQAGAYDSVLNVTQDTICEAIERVIQSYGTKGVDGDQVLVQPMVPDVSMSGVLFSQDPSSGAPFYIINFDDKGDTEAVTSGSGENLRTLVVSRGVKEHKEPWVKKLVLLSRELEEIFRQVNIDVEFACSGGGDLYLLQVRPLITEKRVGDLAAHSDVMEHIEGKLRKFNRPHPYLHGEKTVFGVMPDWNPAEIIGIRPRPLALSLYRELITDNIWAYQRDNYGYKNLRSFPLLVDFYGLPYIDVRVSFNSFLPEDLDSDLSEKLVNYYIEALCQNPALHDKVEFDILFSCYTFDLPQQIQVLADHGFNQAEITKVVESLRALTNSIIHQEKGLWVKDLDKIKILQERHALVMSNPDFDEVSKIYWLIEDCKRYGTLPFAGLARAGFIAVQILNSMVSQGILSEQEKFLFLNSISSVSTSMTEDFQSLGKEDFLEKYGHLRPGTYDILSARYDEEPELYFDWDQREEVHEREEFKLNLTQMKAIESLLKEHQLDYDVIGLLDFLKAAIEGREYAKFVFTKSLSDILKLIGSLGESHALTKEDMSFSNIHAIKNLYSTCEDQSTALRDSISGGREKYAISQRIMLPPLIANPEDIWAFELPDDVPNFVTHNAITAETHADLEDTENMTGSIVCIPSADPGFDWIFSHKIGGLITTYGGANSHMAIRAGELGLPAIIGAGEKLYKKWSAASKLHIDCANKKVEIIQ